MRKRNSSKAKFFYFGQEAGSKGKSFTGRLPFSGLNWFPSSFSPASYGKTLRHDFMKNGFQWFLESAKKLMQPVGGS